MFRLKVDLSEVRQLTRRARRELGNVDDRMQGVVEASAERLRAKDTYQDRTGDLRGSTQGEAIKLGDNAAEATLTMAMPYASFVIGRGFSNWEDEVDRATREMGLEMSAIATRIIRG